MSLIQRNTDINRGWVTVKRGSVVVASGAWTMASGLFQVLRGAHSVVSFVVSEKIKEGVASLCAGPPVGSRRVPVYADDWTMCDVAPVNPSPPQRQEFCVQQGVVQDPSETDEIPIVEGHEAVEEDDDSLLLDPEASFCLARNKHED